MEFLSYDAIARFIYPEYTLAVLITTDLLRFLVKGIDKKIEPKYLCLVIAILLVIPVYFVHHEYNFWKGLVSFGIAILAYQYIWYPIKKNFFKKFKDKQEA
jgi:hypothetical protein